MKSYEQGGFFYPILLITTQQLEITKETIFGAFNNLTACYQNVCNFKTEEIKIE